MQIRVKIIVKGFVQGVGYRYFCYKKAIEYGINGYVKNLVAGHVEIEGEGEKNLIQDFIKDLKIGPSNAQVNSLIVEELPVENKYSDFKIY